MITNKKKAAKSHEDGGATWFPWIAVFILTLITNAGESILFCLGVVVPFIVADFSAPLSLVSLAATIHHVVAGLAAPFVGRLLDIYSVRLILIVGCVLFLIGGLIASLANSIYVFLLSYGIFGLGGVLLHPMVAIKYLGYFFDKRSGIASGIAIWPVGLVVLPPLAYLLVDAWGWRSFFMAIGLLSVGVFCLALLLKQPASRAEKLPTIGPKDNAAPQKYPGRPVSAVKLYRILLTSPVFWVVALSAGILNSIGLALLTHMVVFGAEKGLTEAQAVSLISFYGLAVLAGVPSAGWFIDKYSPRTGLQVISVFCTLGILGLLMVSSYVLLAVILMVISFFVSGTFVCMAGMIRVLVGNLNFGAAIGLTLLLMLPVISLAPGLAGLVHDLSGSYSGYLIGQSVLLSGVCFIFFVWIKNKSIGLYGNAEIRIHKK